MELNRIKIEVKSKREKPEKRNKKMNSIHTDLLWSFDQQRKIAWTGFLLCAKQQKKCIYIIF